jgi:hypothetical protein
MVVKTVDEIGVGATIKQRMVNASEMLGLSVRRIRGYYHREVKLIPAHEAFQIIHLAQHAKREKLAKLQFEYDACRLEVANTAPSWLELLVPPALAPPVNPPDGTAAGGGAAEDR